MANEVTRHIKEAVERELWGRAAARCQFSDCNKILYKHDVTQEPMNLAEKAHIWAFSKGGPRGWGPFKFNRKGINDLANLMLVCHDCHKRIDDDPERYPADLLKAWKTEHEERVRIATGIPHGKRSHVLLYGSRIGEENSPLGMREAYDALFPDRYPADDRPVNLSMHSSLDDGVDAFWQAEPDNLRKLFESQVRPRLEEGNPNHVSVLALAPQPLLILLGSLITDKVPADIYQLCRAPRTWRRQPDPADFKFTVHRPDDTSGPPTALFAISDRIDHARVRDSIGDDAAVWEVTCNDPHTDCIRSERQLSDFRILAGRLFNEIRQAHPTANAIHIIPVMPVSCAVELGRVRQSKSALPWAIYDQPMYPAPFAKRLTLGDHP